MFFVQEEVQKNNDAMFTLFMVVLAYNIFFLSMWFYRFISVLVRINIDRLRHYSVCSWLNHVKIMSYEEELDAFIKKENLLMTNSPQNYRIEEKEKSLKRINTQNFFDESGPSDNSIGVFNPETLSIEHQFLKQRKRML